MERRVFSRVSAISASCGSFLHTFFWKDRNGTKQQTSAAFAVWRGRATEWTSFRARGGARDMKFARTNARGATVAATPQQRHSGEFEKDFAPSGRKKCPPFGGQNFAFRLRSESTYTDIQLKTFIHGMEVFNMKIIMRRDSVILSKSRNRLRQRRNLSD